MRSREQISEVVTPKTSPGEGDHLWESHESAFSVQLSRVFMIILPLALLLGDALNSFWGHKMLLAGTPVQRAVVGSLFVLAAVGAVAAALAMFNPSIRVHRESPYGGFRGVSLRIYEPHLRLSGVPSRNDVVWQLTGSLTLLIYLGVLVAGCIHPLAIPETQAPDSSHTVLLGYSMIASVLVSTLFCVGSRFTYIILAYLLSIGYLVRLQGGFGWDAIVPVTFLLTFNLTLAASLTLLYDKGSRLDAAVARLEQRNQTVAQGRARQVAARRADSYVHDNILSALTPISAGVVGDDTLRGAAKKALESLDMQRQGPGPVTVAQLFSEIAHEIRDKDESVAIEIYNPRTISWLMIAPEVCEAFKGAVDEALKNSLRHAQRSDGLSVSRNLDMRAYGSYLEITFRDDGDSYVRGLGRESRSFRHGINVSIIRRMRDVDGDASVSCEPTGPNQGVVVRTAWKRQGIENLSHVEEKLFEDALPRAAETRTAKAIAAWALVGTLLMILGQVSSYTSLALPLSAVLLQVAVAALLMHSWSPSNAPDWVIWSAVVAIGMSNFVALLPISISGYPGHAAWSLGTSWLLCVLLLFRRGWQAAWAAMGVLGMSTWAWTFVSGDNIFVAVELMLGQIIPLLLWTLAAWWSQQILKFTADTEIQIRDSEILSASTHATTQLLEKRLARLSLRARPTLEALADASRDLDSATRLEAMVLEGELRDEIRAPALCTAKLVDTTREARRRGVEVVLLDDSSGSLPAGVIAEVFSQAISEIRAAESGRVVVRLLPANRENTATIVVSGKEAIAIGAPLKRQR